MIQKSDVSFYVCRKRGFDDVLQMLAEGDMVVPNDDDTTQTNDLI